MSDPAVERYVRSSIDVHNNLLADDIPHELSQLSGPLRDLSSAPAVLGLPAVTVARPTVLGDPDGLVLILAPADRDVDVAQIGELLGRRDLRPVAPDRSPGLTGYLLAFMPPVALESPALIVLDEQLAHQDVIYTTAGEPGVILKIRAADLVKVTNAVVSSVTGTTER
jgi:prolyl-tRNA editing enzyme YbaK/EbsC (Cys-tRNA(Pro) deacylase)